MLLSLDFSSEQPIYLQIRNQIVVAIAGGQLKHGDQLPTIRALAAESGINMMTVSKAYQTLRQEGFIATDRRSGTVVLGQAKKEQPLSEQTLSQLEVIIAEAKLAGVSRDWLLALCGAYFDKTEV